MEIGERQNVTENEFPINQEHFHLRKKYILRTKVSVVVRKRQIQQ